MMSLLLSFLLEAGMVFNNAILRGQASLAKVIPALENDYVFAASVGSVIALPLLYYLLADFSPKNAPPRMSILVPALRGKFDLAMHGPLKAIYEGYKKHGDCFRMKLWNQHFTFLVGHNANAVVFEASDKDFTQKEVYKFTVPVFGKKIVYDAPPSVMIQQLKFVRHGLTGAAMKAHAKKIFEETTDYFSSWPDEGEADLRTFLSELIVLTASRCLLGQEVRERLHTRVAKVYETLERGMTHLSVLFPNLPTPAHKSRDRARVEMSEIYNPIIEERRKRQAEGETMPDDYLQTLIDARYRDGTTLANEEIVGLLVAALFAGQHTSSITSTWMGYSVIREKERHMDKILKEQKEVLSKYDGKLTFEALDEMKYLHNCLKETLRMYPPLVLLMRAVKKDTPYKNMVIPKGDIVVLAPPVTHRLPDVYSNPDDFDPERFSPERNEGNRKFDYIAFGGGRHACLGTNFAYLQIKTIWSILFRTFDFTLVNKTNPRVDYNSMVAGVGQDTKVTFKRRKDFKL